MVKQFYEHPERWLPIIEQECKQLGLKCVVIGGLAAIQWRDEPRDTVDADFVVSQLGELDKVLTEAGFSIRLSLNDDKTPYLINGTTPDGMHIDIYIASTPFEQDVLTRAVGVYSSPEDIIIYKLMAWRPQDRDDIKSILVSGRELDVDYIAHYAEVWDVTDRWQEALSQWGTKG